MTNVPRKKTSCEGNADKGKGFSAMSSKFKAKQEEYLTITLHCFAGNIYLISPKMMTMITSIPQEEEDEKLKKPKTIDAKEAQKVKERKKKELEDVS